MNGPARPALDHWDRTPPSNITPSTSPHGPTFISHPSPRVPCVRVCVVLSCTSCALSLSVRATCTWSIGKETAYDLIFVPNIIGLQDYGVLKLLVGPVLWSVGWDGAVGPHRARAMSGPPLSLERDRTQHGRMGKPRPLSVP